MAERGDKKKSRTCYTAFVDYVFVCCCQGFLNPNGNGSKEFYEALDVTKHSSLADVKKSYKKLSLRYHPDKLRQRGETMTEEKQEQFRQIKQAYEVLSDPERRKVYDRLGINGLTLREDPQKFASDLQDPKKFTEVLEGADWRAYSVVISVTLLIFSYIILFPLLFALEADGDISINWVAVFAPLWLLYLPLAFNVYTNVCRDKAEKPADWPEDAPWEDDTEPLPVRLAFAFGFTLFLLAQILLCVKLDGGLGSVPWPAVLVPYFLYEFAVLLFERHRAAVVGATAGELEAKGAAKLEKVKKRDRGEDVSDEDEDDDDVDDALGFDMRTRAVEARMEAAAHRSTALYHAVRLLQVFIVSLKVEGIFGAQKDVSASWWLVFIPTLVYVVWQFRHYCVSLFYFTPRHPHPFPRPFSFNKQLLDSSFFLFFSFIFPQTEKVRTARLMGEVEQAQEVALGVDAKLQGGDESVTVIDSMAALEEVKLKSHEAEGAGASGSASFISCMCVLLYILLLGFYLTDTNGSRFSFFWFYFPYGVLFGCPLCCCCTVVFCNKIGLLPDELFDFDDNEAVDPEELERVMREKGMLSEGEEFDLEAWMEDDAKQAQVMEAIVIIKDRHRDIEAGSGDLTSGGADADGEALAERSASEDAKTKLLAETREYSDDEHPEAGFHTSSTSALDDPPPAAVGEDATSEPILPPAPPETPDEDMADID